MYHLATFVQKEYTANNSFFKKPLEYREKLQLLLICMSYLKMKGVGFINI